MGATHIECTDCGSKTVIAAGHVGCFESEADAIEHGWQKIGVPGSERWFCEEHKKPWDLPFYDTVWLLPGMEVEVLSQEVVAHLASGSGARERKWVRFWFNGDRAGALAEELRVTAQRILEAAQALERGSR